MTSNNLAKKGGSLAKELIAEQDAHVSQPRDTAREKGERQRKRVLEKEEQEETVVLDQRESEKLLQLAKAQMVNVDQGLADDTDLKNKEKRMRSTKKREDDDSSIEDGEEEDDEDFLEDEDEYEEEEEEVIEISAEDEAAIAAFSRKGVSFGTSSMAATTTDQQEGEESRKTLGDIIFEKLQEHKANLAMKEERVESQSHLNPKVIEVYTSVGELMSRYRAGKVPKAFKILPALKDWEEVLMLTHPENWSPQAMYQATRLFASNMNPKMAQEFYTTVLLPAIRDDIAENKKLNYHLYMSMKKAMYKPSAFFKGILFPLCEDECTLREATIVASVLAKITIPVVHSGAALLKICSMPYAGATSIILKTLINKKYSLPYRVIDALVEYFSSFEQERRELPVLWHQALLVFAQRYKGVLSKPQKEKLKSLLKHQYHKQMTPEIRRELFATGGSA